MRVTDSTRAVTAGPRATQLPSNFSEQAVSGASVTKPTRESSPAGAQSTVAPATDQFAQATAGQNDRSRASGPSVHAPKRQRTKEWTWQKSDAKTEPGQPRQDAAAHKPIVPPEYAVQSGLPTGRPGEILGSTPRPDAPNEPRIQPYVDRSIILQRSDETGPVNAHPADCFPAARPQETQPGVRPQDLRGFTYQRREETSP